MKIQVEESLRDMYLTNDNLVLGTKEDSIMINLSASEKQELVTLLFNDLYKDQQNEIITNHLESLELKEFENLMQGIVTYVENDKLEDKIISLENDVEELTNRLDMYENPLNFN